MGKEPNRGLFVVTPEALCKALRVPDETEVTGMEWDQARGRLLVFAKHADFMEVPPGVAPPLSTFMVTQHTRTAEPEDRIHTYESTWKW